MFALYMHISSAFQKQVHIADLLDAVVKHAPPKALTMMVAVVRAWLSNGGPRLMKNAYKSVSIVYVQWLRKI